VVWDLVGPAAEVGFCYWATDPLDNPDYESFLRDYHGIIGALPPTTTAQPQKHVERLRALLHLWEEHSFVYNRFSILSTRILDVVHREFTAEELVWTGLEMLNKESTKKKATAGRALEKLGRQRERLDHDESVADELTQGTIACVTGFLFNLVTHTVQLVSPGGRQWNRVDGAFKLHYASLKPVGLRSVRRAFSAGDVGPIRESRSRTRPPWGVPEPS
jgi:hypothetical protein